jgi:hypothetical protein
MDDQLDELMHQCQCVIMELAEEINRREALEKLVVSLLDRIATLEYRERLRLMMS